MFRALNGLMAKKLFMKALNVLRKQGKFNMFFFIFNI